MMHDRSKFYRDNNLFYDRYVMQPLPAEFTIDREDFSSFVNDDHFLLLIRSKLYAISG